MIFAMVKLRTAVAQRHDPGSHRFQDLDEHQSYGAHSDDDDGVALFDPGFFHGAEHAGKRFDQGRFVETDGVRQNQQVLADDGLGDLDELRIGAVDELQIFAEVRQVPLAEEALVAGAGVGGYDAHPGRKALDAFADFFHDSGQLVPEDGGRHDHARVESLAIDFQVRSAGEGGLDAHQNFARLPRAEWGSARCARRASHTERPRSSSLW